MTLRDGYHWMLRIKQTARLSSTWIEKVSLPLFACTTDALLKESTGDATVGASWCVASRESTEAKRVLSPNNTKKKLFYQNISKRNLFIKLMQKVKTPF